MEYDRKLTEQFTYGLDDEGMISKIFREVSVLEDIKVATSELDKRRLKTT